MQTTATFDRTAIRHNPLLAGRKYIISCCILTALSLTTETAQGVALQPGFDQALLGSVDGRTRAFGLAVADFNNDAIPDIISGDTYGDVHLYFGNDDGTFTSNGIVINQSYHDAYSLASGDFNGDGAADFVLARTGGDNPTNTPYAYEGDLHLYLGNSNGTFQSTGSFPDNGILIGTAGLDPMSLTTGDVDDDGDLDLISGERIGIGDDTTADILLWRNQAAQGNPLIFTSEVIVQAVATISEETPPYYPPNLYMHVYGLALGDVTGDDVPDLLVGDKAHYLYIYENDGAGNFSPIRYDRVSLRPYAYDRLDSTTFNEGMPLALADVNGDGRLDILTGNAGTNDAAVSLWVHEGFDAETRPVFTKAGEIGSAGTDARGLATGQLNPLVDDAADVVFGNYEGNLYGLFPDIADTDEDGIIDAVDNAPFHANAPRLDINTDGGINHLDQLDNDNDGIGDPADDDDDNDGMPDISDNAPFVANADQADTDGDGIGDVADPFNNTDSDSDGVSDGPLDPDLYAHAWAAKARWSRNRTHFIIRIDALSRAFQNEFTQIMTDAAILTPEEWATNKFESYNSIGDSPAAPGYQVPTNLVGGIDCPLTLVTIPRLIWNAFGDPDPVNWINNRISNPNLEIAQHGTYHVNNTPLGDWQDMPDRNFYSSETAGLSLEENYQLLRVGRRTLLGDYATDPWILDSGVDPATAPKIDWSRAANPLISYAPPFNTGDTLSREAAAQLGYVAWSASGYEEYGPLGPVFSPEGSHHEEIDQFGMFHASADRQVDPETPEGMTYLEFLQSITQTNQLNTWLIEEVEWSSRYCNDLDRLVSCTNAPGGINRENNMIDPARWTNWITLLEYAKAAGEVMTMGDYALAMQIDNAPTVYNPDQADIDQNGIGDAVDGATLTAGKLQIEAPGEASLTGTLLNGSGAAITNQTILFFIDTDGDGTDEQYAAATGTNGVASTVVSLSGGLGTVYYYRLGWDGGLIDAEGSSIVRVGPMAIIDHDFTSEGHFEVTAEGLATNATYRLMRWPDLLNSPDTVVSNFAPAASTDTLVDTNSPADKAFYRVDEE